MEPHPLVWLTLVIMGRPKSPPANLWILRGGDNGEGGEKGDGQPLVNTIEVPGMEKKKRNFIPRRRMHPTPSMLLRKDTPLHPKSRKKNKYEPEVMKMYKLDDDMYKMFSRLAGRVTSLVRSIDSLPLESERRKKCTNTLIDELYDYGVIPSKLVTLKELEGFPASAFARRQLWVICCKKRLGDSYMTAVKHITGAHIKVGLRPLLDPTFFVNRKLENTVRWNPLSPIRRKILEFEGNFDAYEVDEGFEPDHVLETLCEIEPDDILDPTTAFHQTEQELIIDKRKMMDNPFSRLPQFKNLGELWEFQQNSMFSVTKNSMFSVTKVPSGIVIRMNEPFATQFYEMSHKTPMRTKDQKLIRIPAPPGSKLDIIRRKREDRRRTERRESNLYPTI